MYKLFSDQRTLVFVPFGAPEGLYLSVCYHTLIDCNIVLLRQEFSTKSDVFAYGVVLWEMLTRTVPFEGLSMERIRDLVISYDH